MPIVNTYFTSPTHNQQITGLLPELREFLAKELSCGEISLNPNEITIRLIKTEGALIAPIELEIFAHAFADRVTAQDEICLKIRAFVLERLEDITDVRVWLILSELGHSWK